MEKCARASPRSRQQRRSGSASPQKENAARRGIPGNEAAAELRKAVGAAGTRKGRSCAALPQIVAQAHGARRLLKSDHPATKAAAGIGGAISRNHQNRLKR